MGRKLGIKKIISEHEGELNDGTKIIDYSNDLYDLSGDVNGDGTIKVRDVDILFRYFRKKISLEV